jgi:hypothetical protein
MRLWAHGDFIYISVEVALGTDRPATKPLRYQVDQTSEQRITHWKQNR